MQTALCRVGRKASARRAGGCSPASLPPSAGAQAPAAAGRPGGLQRLLPDLGPEAVQRPHRVRLLHKGTVPPPGGPASPCPALPPPGASPGMWGSTSRSPLGCGLKGKTEPVMWSHTGFMHLSEHVSCVPGCVVREELRGPEASTAAGRGPSAGPASARRSPPLPLQPNKVLHEAKELRLLCAEDEQSRTCWVTACRLLKVAGPAARGRLLGVPPLRGPRAALGACCRPGFC